MDNTLYILMFLLFSGHSLHCFNLDRRSEENNWGLEVKKDEDASVLTFNRPVFEVYMNEIQVVSNKWPSSSVKTCQKRL